MSNYGKERQFIKNTLLSASQILVQKDSCSVFEKSQKDLVTSSDYEIEKYIIQQIQEQFPNDYILSEEFNPLTAIHSRIWVLDPLDGTCNYVNKIPLYGIQMALVENEVIVVSGIVLPLNNELYLAVKNEGCTLNDQLIHVSQHTLNHCIVSFGDFNEKKQQETLKQIEIMRKVRHTIMKEKMFGAACIDLTYLASNRISGTFLIASHLWDIVAGILICQEAGAIVCDEKGEPYRLNSKFVIAVNNQSLLKELIDEENI